jgi:DNA polymerase (family 10)
LENRDFSRILSETADLMEIAGEDGFRIRSYRNGAAAIEGYPESISGILANPERKVTDVSGIGKGLAAVLQQIEAHGSCDKRDELLLKFPPAAL